MKVTLGRERSFLSRTPPLSDLGRDCAARGRRAGVVESILPAVVGRGGEVVTRGSAKPPCEGSIPSRASRFSAWQFSHPARASLALQQTPSPEGRGWRARQRQWPSTKYQPCR